MKLDSEEDRKILLTFLSNAKIEMNLLTAERISVILEKIRTCEIENEEIKKNIKRKKKED